MHIVAARGADMQIKLEELIRIENDKYYKGWCLEREFVRLLFSLRICIYTARRTRNLSNYRASMKAAAAAVAAAPVVAAVPLLQKVSFDVSLLVTRISSWKSSPHFLLL